MWPLGDMAATYVNIKIEIGAIGYIFDKILENERNWCVLDGLEEIFSKIIMADFHQTRAGIRGCCRCPSASTDQPCMLRFTCLDTELPRNPGTWTSARCKQYLPVCLH